MSAEDAAIAYRRGNDVDLDAYIELYRDSTLGERRPVDDRARMEQMLRAANLMITAWDDALLVGVARSISDFAFATYLSDLAVRRAYQRKGIGKELMRRTQEAGGRATIFLFSAPAAVAYYPHVGFSEGSGWMLKSGDPIR
jgi:predicted N-acetyltransferase YhbS